MHRVFKNHKDYLGNMLIFFIVLIARTFSQFNSNNLTWLISSTLIPILAVMWKVFWMKALSRGPRNYVEEGGLSIWNCPVVCMNKYSSLDHKTIFAVMSFLFVWNNLWESHFDLQKGVDVLSIVFWIYLSTQIRIIWYDIKHPVRDRYSRCQLRVAEIVLFLIYIMNIWLHGETL